jgi:hypothetical protein
MSIGRTAASALLSSALLAMACNEGPRPTPTGASGISSPGPLGGVSEPTGFIDLSREAYSLPSGIACQDRSIWVSNYVNGGNGPGARIIYRYDLETGRSTGSIPSPSDWTTCLGFDGTALLAIDYTDSVRLFRLSPETGAVLSSFAIPWSGSYSGIAWDGAHFFVADYVVTGDGPSTRISEYSASGEPSGVIYARSGSWNSGSTPGVLGTIRGLTYRDGALWALVSPGSAGAPYRLLSLSVEGAELSSAELSGSAGRDLNYLGWNGTFWTIELLPMSIADFAQGKRLVPFQQ